MRTWALITAVALSLLCGCAAPKVPVNSIQVASRQMLVEQALPRTMWQAARAVRIQRWDVHLSDVDQGVIVFAPVFGSTPKNSTVVTSSGRISAPGFWDIPSEDNGASGFYKLPTDRPVPLVESGAPAGGRDFTGPVDALALEFVKMGPHQTLVTLRTVRREFVRHGDDDPALRWKWDSGKRRISQKAIRELFEEIGAQESEFKPTSRKPFEVGL